MSNISKKFFPDRTPVWSLNLDTSSLNPSSPRYATEQTDGRASSVYVLSCAKNQHLYKMHWSTGHEV